MSDPGKSISRTIGTHFRESYSYPDHVCWVPERGGFISQAEADILSESATKGKLLDLGEKDLHGDGVSDQYRLVETDRHYLVLLNNGYIYANTYTKNDGLQFISKAISQQSRLIGIIPRVETILEAERIIARPSSENKDIYDLVVQGFVIFMGQRRLVEWRFKQTNCQTKEGAIEEEKRGLMQARDETLEGPFKGMNWQKGVDLDGDGLVSPAEKIQVDNPIHECLRIESELATLQEVKEVYSFVEDVLKRVRSHLNDGRQRSNQEKTKLVYEALEELGIRFSDKDISLLTAGVKKKMLDCDTSSFVVKAIAHEMGWPIYLVGVPGHVFVRWEETGGERFNSDFGYVFEDEYYVKKFKLSQASIDAGVYLSSQSSQGLRSHFFNNRGATKADLGRHKGAIKDYDEAIRLTSK